MLKYKNYKNNFKSFFGVTTKIVYHVFFFIWSNLTGLVMYEQFHI